MAKIKAIRSRQILDSRGWPTVETEITLEDGAMGRAAVPSGASTGSHEALELRDGDTRQYGGRSVLKAVQNVNAVIAEKVIGMDAADQRGLDQAMVDLDGTDGKQRLGANAILSVSLAAAVAQAKSVGSPLYKYLNGLESGKAEMVLPKAMFNIINGGKHAKGSMDFQEFMIVPQQKTFSERLRCGAEVFHFLQKILAESGRAVTVGDEGGFAPKFSSNLEPFELILAAISGAGYSAGTDVGLAIDFAASEFFEDGKYNLKTDGKVLDTDQMISYIEEIVSKYPLVSIEDPLQEDDFEGWAKLNAKIGSKVQIVGDDLYVTNTERLKKGIEVKASNAILIKPNQIGTLTETIEAIELAKGSGMNAVVSHRSGETEDTFIADLAVGLGTGQIKSGSLSRSERLSKYNQLLRIEEQLNS